VYDFHGRGCAITSTATDEIIDVDFHDDSSDHIDPFFFLRHLTSLRRPGPIEARVLALHPEPRTLALAYDALFTAGLLVRHARRQVFRLSDAAQALSAGVEALAERWKDPALRPWCAAALGDWPLVAELLPGQELIAERARRSIAERITALEACLDRPDLAPDALVALSEVASVDGRKRNSS
jgi:hypothetical protein